MSPIQLMHQPEFSGVDSQQLFKQPTADHLARWQPQALVKDVASEEFEQMRHIREAVDLPAIARIKERRQS